MKLICFLVAVTLVSGSPVRLVGRDHHELSCSICQHLTEDLHNVLSTEDTQTKVVSGLLSRCNGLVNEQNEVCKDIVQSMAPNMVHFLTNKIHPYIMCSSLEMCPEEHVVGEHIPVDHVEEEHVPEKRVNKVDVCEFCQFAINVVERYAHANGSIAKLNETMYHFCNSLPDPFKTECLNFTPAVIKALANGVPPHQACVKAHVCPSNTIEFPLTWNKVTCDICNGVSENMFGEDAGAVCMELRICLRPTQPAKEKDKVTRSLVEEMGVEELEAGPGCELCQFVVNTIDTYLKDNHTEAAINATITKLCNELPEPLKDTCLGFAPQLVKILAQGFDPKQACTKIGLCETEAETQKEAIVPKSQGKAEAGPGCELCQFVVNTIDTYLKDNHTEAAINATITKLCNELPEPLKDTCNSFAPQLVKILAQGFDPKQACTKIGLCATSQVADEHRTFTEEEWEKLQAGPGCELCQFVVNVIDQYLKDNHTEGAINATITKICNDLPEPLKDTCFGFAPQLVKILAQGLDPKQACTKIGLCSSIPQEAEEDETEEVEETPEEVTVKEPTGPGCELCQFVVNTIDTYLKDNHTEAAINATITKICNELPEPLKDTCNAFAPQLVKILAQGFDPKQACTKIGLCSSTEDVEEPLVVHEERSTEEHEEHPAAGPGCELCQFVVNTIDTYLKDNHTEAAINATITKICNELPEPLKDTCNAFAPQLVKILAQGFDPKQACTKIGLCSSTEDVEEPLVVHEERSTEEHEEHPAAGPGCELCQFVVNTIDTYLKDNHTEAAINATITKLCNELPEALKDMCNSFAPQLVKILAQGFDPKQACTKIGLCASTEYHGGERHIEEPEEHEVVAGPGCELCQFVVNTIDTYLKDNHTEAAINATITKLCNELPEPLKDMCNSFAPQLVKILAQGFDPKQACTKIGLCSRGNFRYPGTDHVIRRDENDQIASTPECDLCELVVKTVDKYLTKNATEAFVNTTILRACLGLPEPLKSTCLQFAPELVQAISQGVDPNVTCIKIKLCSANEVPIFEHMTCDVCESRMERVFPETFKKVCALTCTSREDREAVLEGFAHEAAVALKKPESSLTCELCILLVKTLDTYLNNNHSEAAINSTIYKICDSLPAALKLECHVMAPMLVKELVKGFNGTKACTAIHACDANKELLTRMVRGIQEETGMVGTAECTLCKGLIGFIDKGFDGDEAKTKQKFDDVCHRLPPPTDQKCLDFVDPNFPKIWDQIIHGDFSPEKVCHAIKLCKDNNTAA